MTPVLFLTRRLGPEVNPNPSRIRCCHVPEQPGSLQRCPLFPLLARFKAQYTCQPAQCRGTRFISDQPCSSRLPPVRCWGLLNTPDVAIRMVCPLLIHRSLARRGGLTVRSGPVGGFSSILLLTKTQGLALETVARGGCFLWINSRQDVTDQPWMIQAAASWLGWQAAQLCLPCQKKPVIRFSHPPEKNRGQLCGMPNPMAAPSLQAQSICWEIIWGSNAHPHQAMTPDCSQWWDSG